MPSRVDPPPISTTLKSRRGVCARAPRGDMLTSTLCFLYYLLCGFQRGKKGAFPAERPAGSDLVTLAESHFWRASFLWDKFMMLCKPVIMLW